MAPPPTSTHRVIKHRQKVKSTEEGLKQEKAMNRIYAARRRRKQKIDVLSDRKNRLLAPLSPKDQMSVENEVRKNSPMLIKECCTDGSSKFMVTKNDQKQMRVLTILEYEIHLLEARNRNAKNAEKDKENGSCDDFGEEVDATNPLPLLLRDGKPTARFVGHRKGELYIMTDDKALTFIRRTFYYPNYTPPKQASTPSRLVIAKYSYGFSSFVLRSFGTESPDTARLGGDILTHLLTSPTHAPWDIAPGPVITCDSTYGNPPKISSCRPTYYRNTFADTVMPTRDPQTHFVAANGTGSGRSTVGTPPNLMCIRQKTKEMQTFSNGVHSFIKQLLSNQPTINTSTPFNVFVVHMMRPWQKVPLHSDCSYDPDGNFKTNSNSQQENSPVAIFVFGEPRILIFKLMRYVLDKDRNLVKVPVGPKFKISLTHGCLFILDPREEKPEHRYGLPYKTFWYHYGNGIKKRQTMSLGITLRTCVHSVEVYKDTGLKKLTPNEIHDSYGNNKSSEAFLRGWCSGYQLKDIHVPGEKYKPTEDLLQAWCSGSNTDTSKLNKAGDDRDLMTRFLQARTTFSKS